MSRSKVCAHCAFFLQNERTDGSQGGICRRYPPVPMILQQSTIAAAGTVGMAGVSPPVDPGFTCGEFQDAATMSLVTDGLPV